MTVDGYGNITSSNAYQIYSDWKSGKVELSTAQQKYTERFLTQEQMDQIEYDTGNASAKKTGAEQINTDGTDKKEGVNASLTSLGMAAGAYELCADLALAKSVAKTDGNVALVMAIVAAAGATLTYIMANMFDSAYDERTAAEDASDDSDATIEGYTNALDESMDMMNEDMDAYQQGSTQMTLDINSNTSALADLQIQLADAQSAGDIEGAKSIKEQISQLQKADFSGQQDELDELGAKLQDYQDSNAESTGVAESGNSVADFLKAGTPLGVVAAVDAVVLAVASAYAGICIASATMGSAKSASHWDFVGMTAGIVAAGIFGIATGMIGKSANTMKNKATAEFDCGSAGRDMQGYVNDLYAMIGEQGEYIETTGENFTATDEASAESQAKAQENANKAVGANTTGNGPTKDPNKKDDEPSNQGSGGTSGSAVA